jgi:hypothetical protein
MFLAFRMTNHQIKIRWRRRSANLLCDMAMTYNTSNYLLCDRFNVYTSFPDFVFPEDITVLPIDEDKWVVACLEFPNDEDF